jgi:hypothetical protein
VTDLISSIMVVPLHAAQGKRLFLAVDAAGSARPSP